MCFGFQLDGSFEYPQHTFWLRNAKNNFQLYTLIGRPVCLNNNDADKSAHQHNFVCCRECVQTLLTKILDSFDKTTACTSL